MGVVFNVYPKRERRKMFHVTPVANQESILRNGLIPSIGPRSAMINESIPIVCLFNTLNDLMCATWLEDCFADDELVVFEVNIHGLFLTPTFGTDSWEYTSNEIISPHRLTLRTDVKV